MGRPTATDEMPLQPQVHLEPFEKWALDFIGPINPTSNGKRYILVCTDYVTKWAEAKALVRATEQTVVNFLFEEIFCKVWSTKGDSNRSRYSVYFKVS